MRREGVRGQFAGVTSLLPPCEFWGCSSVIVKLGSKPFTCHVVCLCVGCFACTHVCALLPKSMPGAQRGQERVSELLELESRMT